MRDIEQVLNGLARVKNGGMKYPVENRVFWAVKDMGNLWQSRAYDEGEIL